MNTDEFRVDGYLEHPEDIYDGHYEFIQEDSRVLYPYMKISQGGLPGWGRWCRILKRKSIHEICQDSAGN